MNVLNEKNFAKGTLSNHLHDYKVLKHRNIGVSLLSIEYKSAALSHTLAGSWFLGASILSLFFFLLIIVVVILILVCEVFGLLELLVSYFHVFLKIIHLLFKCIVFNLTLSGEL
jgi:hypothetical protein